MRMAMNAMEERKVKVNRQRLVETLKANREKHVSDYQEAIAGYTEEALSKLGEAAKAARVKLDKNIEQAQKSITEFDPNNPQSASDTLTLVEGISVRLPVPRNFSEVYDAALAMFEWEVADEVELTYAEFQCLVRDLWEWKAEFISIASAYNNKLRR